MFRIVVNVQLHERRVAILEDDKLVELRIEQADERRIVGNIYKGVVENVVHSLNAAFIEIGTGKRAFLHITDIAPNDPFRDENSEDGDRKFFQPTSRSASENISRVLAKKRELIVQIYKDSIGPKGARCTTQLSIPGRYLVLMPGENHIGVSRKISERSERARLKAIIFQHKPPQFGVIVRTIARGLPGETLESDLKNLLALWNKIQKRAQDLPPGSVVYRDEGLIPSLVRDQLSDEVIEFIIDSEDEFKKIRDYVKKVAPHLSDRIKLHKSSDPIFKLFAIEHQIEQMSRRSVRLASGGQIVIDQTEALVSIDVNSSRSSGKGEYEDMILRVNVEAAEEIARQLRLRDLGGLIVVDFIDMRGRESHAKVENAFREALAKDRANMKILPMNEFCMVVLSRSRDEQSLITRITDECPMCKGVGRILSSNTVAASFERWLKTSVDKLPKTVILIAHPLLAAELVSDTGVRLEELGEAYGVDLEVFADPSVHPNTYRVLDANTGDDISESIT